MLRLHSAAAQKPFGRTYTLRHAAARRRRAETSARGGRRHHLLGQPASLSNCAGAQWQKEGGKKPAFAPSCAEPGLGPWQGDAPHFRDQQINIPFMPSSIDSAFSAFFAAILRQPPPFSRRPNLEQSIRFNPLTLTLRQSQSPLLSRHFSSRCAGGGSHHSHTPAFALRNGSGINHSWPTSIEKEDHLCQTRRRSK